MAGPNHAAMGKRAYGKRITFDPYIFLNFDSYEEEVYHFPPESDILCDKNDVSRPTRSPNA
jgi:hypothetical protein